jgi:hypothetical protein
MKEPDMATENMFEAQVALERLTHKNHAMGRLRSEFDQADLVEHIEAHDLPVPFCIDLMAQLVLRRKAKLTVLVGLLHKHFMHDDISPNDSLQACADMIIKAGDANLVDYDSLSTTVYYVLDISKDVKDEMACFQYPLPMIVEPKELKNNRDTGYLTTKSSVILKNNHTEDDVCLDHINRMNRIPLRINYKTSWMIDNSWADLDHQKEDETVQDYADRVMAFRRYTATAYEVMETLAVTGDRFWLTHKYDKRGRTYCQGHHVSYQGADWNKACIELADKETING